MRSGTCWTYGCMLVVDWDSVEGGWVGIFIELLSLNVHSEDCTLVSVRSMQGKRNTHYNYDAGKSLW